MLRRITPLVLLALALPHLANAQSVIFSETESGDLSDDFLKPGRFTLSEGTSFLRASVNEFDLDVFTIEVAAGLQLDSIFLRSYSSAPANLSFLGFQEGAITLSAPPSAIFPDPINWALIGEVSLGDDVLPAMVATNPTLTAPLPSGDYAFWFNETTRDASATIEFNTSEVAAIPEPTSVALLLTGGVLAFLRRRGS